MKIPMRFPCIVWYGDEPTYCNSEKDFTDVVKLRQGRMPRGYEEDPIPPTREIEFTEIPSYAPTRNNLAAPAPGPSLVKEAYSAPEFTEAISVVLPAIENKTSKKGKK